MKVNLIFGALMALCVAVTVVGNWWFIYEQPCREANEVYGYEIKRWGINCYVKMHNGKLVPSNSFYFHRLDEQ